jgi:hypothetical protein
MPLVRCTIDETIQLVDHNANFIHSSSFDNSINKTVLMIFLLEKNKRKRKEECNRPTEFHLIF